MRRIALNHGMILLITSIMLCIIIGSIVGMNNNSISKGMNAGSTVPGPANNPGNSDQAGDEWPMFRGSLNHTGTVTTITPVQGNGPLWTVELSSVSVWSSTTVAAGRVYVETDKLYCLNSSSGKSIWNYSKGGYSTPAVAGGRLYVGSTDKKIYCINASTGAHVWNYTTGGIVTSSPAIANGRVYFGSYDKNVYCLNATTGTKIWNYTTGNLIGCSPAIESGRVYIGSSDKKIYCLNATTGTKMWNYTTGGGVFSSPSVVSGRVYTASYDYKVYCLNSTTGSFIWSYKTSSWVDSSPAVDGGRVYIGSHDWKIHCVNAITGTSIWNYTTSFDIFSSPAVASGRVYVGGEDNKLHCLDATTGNSLWNYTAQYGQIFASPAIVGGRVYIVSYNNKVYCLPMILTPALPFSPRNFQATGGNGLISLTWQAPELDYGSTTGSAVTNYIIYRGTTPGSEVFVITLGNVTTWTDTGRANGLTYYYKLGAVNGAGEGTRASAAGCTFDFHSPSSSDPTGDEWPMFRGALNHTGIATTTPVQGTGPSWTCMTGGPIATSSPAVVGGRVYIGTYDNKIYCLNATTGAFIWNFTMGDDPGFSPAVTGGRVYVGSIDGNLYCLNATTGGLIWAYKTGDAVYAAPAVIGGRVYAGSYDDNLYCLNATTGIKIWNYTMGGGVISSTAIVGGRAYTGCYDGKVYCLNATTGSLVWSYRTWDFIDSSPAVAGGRVYVGSADYKLYCLNANTGASIWNYTTTYRIEGSPAISGSRVFIGSEDGILYCLNATTGSSIWNYTTSTFLVSSPAVASGRVYIGDFDGKMYCINVTTGIAQSAYVTGGSILSSPAIAGGRVYIGSYDSKVYCFPMIVLPGSPRNIHASSGNAQVTLAWQAPAKNYGMISSDGCVRSYKIYRSTSPGNEFYYTTTINMTTFTDYNVQPDHVYYYQVSAVSWMGEGSRSSEANASPLGVPSAPRNVHASVINGHAVITWQAPAHDGGLPITNYTVFRSTVSGGETFLIMIGNTSMFTDTTVVIGHDYYYTVDATNAAGEGAQSSEITVLPALVPGPPQELHATGKNGLILLTWRLPSNTGGASITGYNVYRGTSAGVETFLMFVGNTTACADISILDGQAYYYIVTALNAAGEGARSAEANATVIPASNNPGDSYFGLSIPALIIIGGAAFFSIFIALEVYQQGKKQMAKQARDFKEQLNKLKSKKSGSSYVSEPTPADDLPETRDGSAPGDA